MFCLNHTKLYSMKCFIPTAIYKIKVGLQFQELDSKKKKVPLYYSKLTCLKELYWKLKCVKCIISLHDKEVD